MKKVISILLLVAIMLSMSITAFAGSIPEDLLHSDDAQIFFAEVVYYHPDKENPDIELSPVKVVKGDVKTGVKLTCYNPNTVGDFKVKEGNVYLFTYFDENNPTDIFEVTSYDTSTLKLKNVEGDMWKRFEKYLNEGRYLDAEQERLDNQNEGLPVEGENISLVELIGVPKEKKGQFKSSIKEQGVEKSALTFLIKFSSDKTSPTLTPCIIITFSPNCGKSISDIFSFKGIGGLLFNFLDKSINGITALKAAGLIDLYISKHAFSKISDIFFSFYYF